MKILFCLSNFSRLCPKADCLKAVVLCDFTLRSAIQKRMATTEPPTKMTRHLADERKKIGTHNGTFHCDEVMACYLLKLLPEYKEAEIIRTRDPSLLSPCDVVVDVGGVFDASANRYDHHQRDFAESMKSLSGGRFPWTTKLSSAGLVYLHFGARILSQLLGRPQDDSIVDVIFEKIYENLFEEIDAVDNGIDVAEDKRYVVTTTLSQRVGRCNPRWNEKDQDEWKGFERALKVVAEEFEDRVEYYRDSWWPARTLVSNAVENRFHVHSSGKMILIESGGCPWKDHLFALEEELGIQGNILYVLYFTSGQWRVQCVPKVLGSFGDRKSLPNEWRGLRDETLTATSGVDGCVFVHATGFIGGNRTKEGCVDMAAKALAL